MYKVTDSTPFQWQSDGEGMLCINIRLIRNLILIRSKLFAVTRVGSTRIRRMIMHSTAGITMCIKDIITVTTMGIITGTTTMVMAETSKVL